MNVEEQLGLVLQKRLELLEKDDAELNPNRLKLLDGIAKTAMEEKRLNSDNNNAAADREVQKIINSAIIGNKTITFKREGDEKNNNISGAKIPDIELVPDETLIHNNMIK